MNFLRFQPLFCSQILSKLTFYGKVEMECYGPSEFYARFNSVNVVEPVVV